MDAFVRIGFYFILFFTCMGLETFEKHLTRMTLKYGYIFYSK